MLLSFQMLPEQPAPELLDAIALADGLGYYGCYSAALGRYQFGTIMG